MKLKKLIILILSALSLIALSISLSACGFLDGIFGKDPSGGTPSDPPAEEQPDSPEDPEDPEEPKDPEAPAACAHLYGDWQDEINECTLHKVYRTCSLCSDTEYKFVAPEGHKYGGWQDEIDTCTQHTQKRVCSKCGDEYERDLIPKGHKFGDWKDRINTCVSHVQNRTCSVCNHTEKQTLPPAGHKYGEWQDDINTCTKHTQKRVCSVCNDEEIKTLPAADHIYGAWVDDLKTCTQHVQKQTCRYCDDVNVRYLKTSGHKYVEGVCEYCKQSLAESDSTSLDKYNGDYGYNYFKANNLTAQQTLYERIDAQARAFHVSKDINAVPFVHNGKTCYIVSEIPYSDLSLSSDEAISVWKTYKDDNPLYYWLSGELVYTNAELNILSVEEYAQGEARITANDFVYNKVTEYSLMLEATDNAYRKALAFHDKIISAVDYAYDSGNQPQSAAWAHNVMGVFQEKGAVCEGYAKTFQLLLNYNGVENIFVSGAGNSEDHAWNLVKLDDGKWYWCDLTWDDTPSWEWGISYYYFLVNDTQTVNWRDGGWYFENEQNFLDSHTPDTPQGANIKFGCALPVRSQSVCSGGAFPAIRQTFKLGGKTYAVTGYNTVQLVKCEADAAAHVPEEVTYGGITYTVISIGTIDKDGTFGSSTVFKGATSVFIPKTVKFIWDNAMVCSTNAQITVDGENEYFCSVEGVLFTKSLKTLVSYPAMRTAEAFNIPDNTERIAQNAFRFNQNLARLYLGKSLCVAGVTNWGSGYDNSRNIISYSWESILTELKQTEGTGIFADADNAYYSSDTYFLYNKNKTCVYCCFDSSAEEVEIPATVRAFDHSLFAFNAALKRINFGGTTQDWLAIAKIESWCVYDAQISIVCTNGTLDAKGNLIL